MSLVDCLKKAGKAINKKDADFLLQKREELIANGVADADAVALRILEDEATLGIDEILAKAGRPAQKAPIKPGVPVIIDDVIHDSNKFISDIDAELNGIESIRGCIYK